MSTKRPQIRFSFLFSFNSLYYPSFLSTCLLWTGESLPHDPGQFSRKFYMYCGAYIPKKVERNSTGKCLNLRIHIPQNIWNYLRTCQNPPFFHSMLKILLSIAESSMTKQCFESIPGNRRPRQTFHHTYETQPISQKTVSVFSDLDTKPLSDNT